MSHQTRRIIACLVLAAALVQLPGFTLAAGGQPLRSDEGEQLVPADPLATRPRSEAELARLLQESPHAQELIAIAADLYNRAAQADPEALRAAVEKRDAAEVGRLMGLGTEESNALSARLNDLRLAIFKEFPEVAQLAREMAPTACGLDPSAGACMQTREGLLFRPIPRAPSGPVTCRWAQYITALALCSLGGPVWYWPCAYLALCSYCSGGWVDHVCF